MNIIGLGVDIEDIGRFRKLQFPKNKSFYQKIFTPREIKYCLSRPDPYPSFAARFAAKEAVIKALPALGGALPKSVKNFHAIEILMKNKKPQVSLKGFKILVSLSHEKDKAIAMAIVGQ